LNCMKDKKFKYSWSATVRNYGDDEIVAPSEEEAEARGLSAVEDLLGPNVKIIDWDIEVEEID